MVSVRAPASYAAPPERGRPTTVAAVREAGPSGPPRPRLLDRVRDGLHTRHYSRRTDKAYIHWIKTVHLLPELVHIGQAILGLGGGIDSGRCSPTRPSRSATRSRRYAANKLRA